MDSVANGRQNLSPHSLLQCWVCLGAESVLGYSSTSLGAIHPGSQVLYNYRELYLGADVKTQLSGHFSSTRGRVSGPWPALVPCAGEITWQEFIPYHAPLCGSECQQCWGMFSRGSWGRRRGRAPPMAAAGPCLAAEAVRAVL